MQREGPAGEVPVRVLQYGVDEPLPERLSLRAGPLGLIYEAGDLRTIRLGGHEVLRRVYAAVRDRNWDTVPAVLSVVRIERDRDSFVIRYRAEHKQGAIDFAWDATIRGDAEGTITFAMEGEARSTFLRNRLGLCVHHPIRECAGRPCTVEHVDGTIEDGAFPREIAPHQPFRDVRAISHEVIPGLRAEVRFTGEVFEMEDQRNWTDASFKTYGTPLDRPFPVEVLRGSRIAQTVTLSLSRPWPAAIAVAAPRAVEITFAVGAGPVTRLPDIGLGLASHAQPLREDEEARLRALHLSHLRLDVTPSRPDAPDVLQRGVRTAARVGAAPEVALFLTDADEELDALRAMLDAIRPAVLTWWIFHASEKSTPGLLALRAGDVLRRSGIAPRIGGGTNAYFAELNRGRPPVADLDLVVYSINPQVHASDRASLVENIAAQADTARSARALAGGRPVAVGPITLKPRFNPNATAAESTPAPGELPSQVDPRQMSLLGAGWTLGSLAALCRGGATALTYYETIGWRGVMETEAGPTLPERFRSLPGSVFPLYHVLADVGEFAGGTVTAAATGDPGDLAGLALVRGDRTRVLLANLRPEPRRARVVGLAPTVRVRSLDATNATRAMREPEAFRAQDDDRRRTADGTLELDLPPFGLVRIDGGGEGDRDAEK